MDVSSAELMEQRRVINGFDEDWRKWKTKKLVGVGPIDLSMDKRNVDRCGTKTRTNLMKMHSTRIRSHHSMTRWKPIAIGFAGKESVRKGCIKIAC